MEFDLTNTRPETQHAGCVVVGFYESLTLSSSAKSLDLASGGAISEALKRSEADGKTGSSLLLHCVPRLPCKSVLLIGLGDKNSVRSGDYQKACRAAAKALAKHPTDSVACYLPELAVVERGHDWKVEKAALALFEGLYRFDRFKTKAGDGKRPCKTLLLAAAENGESGRAGLARALAIGQGMQLTRDLANLPANICTPDYLADTARDMAQRLGAQAQILGPDAIEELGMHSFLAVAKGSTEAARLIVLEHHGATSPGERPVVLVGKGITFDSGGLSLKPAASMEGMKYDMCGAAAVLGAFQAAVELRLAINLTVIIPACENMPSGHALRPGDIVTSLSGQTIEVLNTDAEGRLILCDALTYASRLNPAAIIDVATLTGACVTALGHVNSGLFANDDGLARELFAAGIESGDRAWQLPLHDDYQEQLDSAFADMRNIGGSAAGSVTAACFLSRFTGDYRWAHLDIAGTATSRDEKAGATGRPVPLLVQFLLDKAASNISTHP